MRWWAILAASLAASSAAYAQEAKPEEGAAHAALQQTALEEERAPNDLLRRTSPPNAAADRTYGNPEEALLQGDMDYLVREGDQLPKKVKKTFKAGESLKAGSAASIKS